jgi:hypothetical protein
VTDLTTMTPAEILNWSADSRFDAKDAAVFATLGVTDLDDLKFAQNAGWPLLTEARALAAAGTYDGPADLVLHALTRVGHRVLGSELDNLDIWLPIADTITGYHRAGGWNQTSTATVLNDALDARRGPNYVMAMIEAAARANLQVNALGFAGGIEPPTFKALARAGVTSRLDLQTFLDYGVSIADIIGLAEAGVGHGAVAAAVATGLPKEQWLTTLPGLNNQWFPTNSAYDKGQDPASGMLKVAGGDWQILRELANSGWFNVSNHDFQRGRISKKTCVGDFTIDNALRACRAGISYESIDAWGKALTSGKGGAEWTDQALPPVSGRYSFDLGAAVDVISKLMAAGIKVAWVGEFRACGARNIQDLVRIGEAGITAKEAEKLRNDAGEKFSSYRPPRFQSIGRFFAAHAEAAAKAERAAD